MPEFKGEVPERYAHRHDVWPSEIRLKTLSATRRGKLITLLRSAKTSIRNTVTGEILT